MLINSDESHNQCSFWTRLPLKVKKVQSTQRLKSIQTTKQTPKQCFHNNNNYYNALFETCMFSDVNKLDSDANIVNPIHAVTLRDVGLFCVKCWRFELLRHYEMYISEE